MDLPKYIQADHEFQESLVESVEAALAPDVSSESPAFTVTSSDGWSIYEENAARAATCADAPDLVPRMHGALCPLVGCEAYGCWSSRGSEADEGR